MKKSYFIVSGAIIAALAFSKFGVFQALLLFFLVGAIPGSSVSVPSSMMLFLILITAWLLVFRFTALKTYELRTVSKLTKAFHARKNNLPKRRFEQVS